MYAFLSISRTALCKLESFESQPHYSCIFLARAKTSTVFCVLTARHVDADSFEAGSSQDFSFGEFVVDNL